MIQCIITYMKNLFYFNHTCSYIKQGQTLSINSMLNLTFQQFSKFILKIMSIIILLILNTKKMRQKKGKATSKTSNLIVTQSVTQILLAKYDNRFNFYFTKSINHIIYNRNSQQATLTAKDITVLVEDIDYLKRYYTHNNEEGKNQIKDRMCKLLNFYANSNMLQYQYPCMVVNRMEEVFKKRRKKLRQSENQQSSEQDSGQILSEKQILVQRQTEKEEQQLELLEILDWSDIVNCNQHKQKQKNVKEILDYEQEYSVYGQQFKNNDSFFRKIHNLTSEITYQMSFDDIQNQKQVRHLILDFDDLDKERIVNQYTKLTNKQNIPYRKNQTGLKILRMQSLTQKKPLSSSITIDTFKQFGTKQRNGGLQSMNRQSMLIGSRQQRVQQIKVMKKSSDLQYQANKQFLFSEDKIINQNQYEESPLHQDYSSFSKRSQMSNHFFRLQNKKAQGQTIMKQSQIIHNDYFIKDKYQNYNQNNNFFKSQLKKLKENPFELKEILKIEINSQADDRQFKKQDLRQNQHKNEMPFYLKRVKSHQLLKIFVQDDRKLHNFKKRQ